MRSSSTPTITSVPTVIICCTRGSAARGQRTADGRLPAPTAGDGQLDRTIMRAGNRAGCSGQESTRGLASASRGSRLRGARSGPLLRVCLEPSRHGQSTPSGQRRQRTDVPARGTFVRASVAGARWHGGWIETAGTVIGHATRARAARSSPGLTCIRMVIPHLLAGHNLPVAAGRGGRAGWLRPMPTPGERSPLSMAGLADRM